jgi:hypothetical protein
MHIGQYVEDLGKACEVRPTAKEITMSVQQFVETQTVEAPGRSTSVRKVQTAYQARYGRITRSEFLRDLVAAGIPVVTADGSTYLVGRTLPAGALAPAAA